MSDLESRVERLESQMDSVLANGSSSQGIEAGPDSWRNTIGMFRGDSLFQEMIDGVAETRSRERQQAEDSE